MAKKKLNWNHKKHGKGFIGFYEYTEHSADRAFVLVLGRKKKSYESPAAARKDGWVSQ